MEGTKEEKRNERLHPTPDKEVKDRQPAKRMAVAFRGKFPRLEVCKPNI